MSRDQRVNDKHMESVCSYIDDDAAGMARSGGLRYVDAEDDMGGAQDLLQDPDMKTRLRTALEMYEQALEDLNNQGLMDRLQQLDGKEATEFFKCLKERLESTSFLEQLCGHRAQSETGNPSKRNPLSNRDNTWLLVDKDDTFKREEDDNEGYVVVTQDDIVDGIACFMVKYMSAVPKAKELSPQELQKAVSKALGALQNKGKIKKLWKYGKLLYTAASWSATAVGLYNNPPVSRDALMYMWTTICILIQSLK